MGIRDAPAALMARSGAMLGHGWARASVLTIAILASPPVAATDGDGQDASKRARERAWYVPDQAKLQLAGNIGFISPGVGWAWLDRRLTADAFFGWVPEAFGGNIFAVTAKLTWQPWAANAGGRFELRPLTAAFQLTYSFGGSYFVDQPSRFPDGYYPLPTALRSGIAFGQAASWRWSRNGQQRVGIYYELVALDVMLLAWARNTRSVSLADVFTLAIGTSVEF